MTDALPIAQYSVGLISTLPRGGEVEVEPTEPTAEVELEPTTEAASLDAAQIPEGFAAMEWNGQKGTTGGTGGLSVFELNLLINNSVVE